jgi:hypothetical protein
LLIIAANILELYFPFLQKILVLLGLPIALTIRGLAKSLIITVILPFFANHLPKL